MFASKASLKVKQRYNRCGVLQRHPSSVLPGLSQKPEMTQGAGCLRNGCEQDKQLNTLEFPNGTPLRAKSWWEFLIFLPKVPHENRFWFWWARSAISGTDVMRYLAKVRSQVWKRSPTVSKGMQRKTPHQRWLFFSRNPLVIGSNLSETPILPVQSLESSMISITSQKNRFAKNIPVNVPLCSVWPKSTHSCSWTRTLHGICFCSPLNSWRWSLFSLSLCSKCALPACWLVACASAKESRNYRNWKRLCPLHRSLEQDLTQSRNWLGISSVSQCKSRWLGRGQHFWQSQKHFLVSWFSHLFHEAFPGCIFFFKIVCSEQNWVS